jgi:hypothetical protein
MTLIVIILLLLIRVGIPVILLVMIGSLLEERVNFM